jgi:AP-4 complex subunit epsilon-1
MAHIRHLLSSDASEQHLFLSCLACVPPAIWAGTTQDVPAVLEAWEVDLMMQLLSAPDLAIRLEVCHPLFIPHHNLDRLSDSTHLDKRRPIHR